MAPTLLTLFFKRRSLKYIYFHIDQKSGGKDDTINEYGWNMDILMIVEWWTLTSESRSSETLVFCFSPGDFPLKIPGHEESDTMQLSLQITWHRQQKPVETCFKLTMQKRKHVLFPHGNAHLKSGRDLWLFTPK